MSTQNVGHVLSRGLDAADLRQRWVHRPGATEPRQKREADDAVAVPELIVSHCEEDDGEADGQIEVAALRAQAGLASLGADTRIVQGRRGRGRARGRQSSR